MKNNSRMKPGLSFSDTATAFKSRNTKELNHSYWLFRLMQQPLLVKIFSGLTVFLLRAGIPVKGIIKATIFKHFCGGESLEESREAIEKLNKEKVGAILDYSVEGKEREEDLEQTQKEILKIISLAANNPAIPYTSIKITGIARAGLLEKISSRLSLSPDESAELSETRRRVEDLCSHALRSGVPVYFDAEESWIQSAIDELAEEMMKKYNRQKTIVLTTLQMYRHDRMEYLHTLIRHAREGKYFIGIKLVRGAYLEKENKRALEKGYPTPIQPDKETTDRDFNAAVETCLPNLDVVTLCAGTHDEKSTLFLVRRMKELNIVPGDPRIYFSQLYGMSDHITYNLAEAGYNVTKYLPYGPVKSVIPYLIRRAEENTAIAGQMGRELRLITEERKRRQQMKTLPAR